MRLTDRQKDLSFKSTSLQALLHHFRLIDGVDLAAIVAPDGLLIDDIGRADVDTDAIRALAANGFAFAEARGSEINKGSPEQFMVEYALGLVVIDLLTPDAMLLILMESRDQLGRVSSLMHEHHNALVEAMYAIAAPHNGLCLVLERSSSGQFLSSSKAGNHGPRSATNQLDRATRRNGAH